MGRKSSAPARRAPAPASRSAPPPAAPAPRAAAPPAMAPQQSSGGGMMSGIGSTIVQGFAFGTGSALAREAVGSIFGGSSSHAPAQAAPAPQPVAPAVPQACEYDHKAFVSCLQQNPNNATECDHYFSALQACQARM